MGGSKKDPMMSEYPPGQGPPVNMMDERPMGGSKKDPMMSEYPPG